MTTKGGLENNIPQDVAVQYRVYVAVRQVLLNLHDSNPGAFLEKYYLKKQSVKIKNKKSRDEKPRQMTTKGGLENNIPQDVAMQYKIYVALRQAFYMLINPLIFSIDAGVLLGWLPQKPSRGI